MKKRTLEEINEIYHKIYSYIDVLEFNGYGKHTKLFCNQCNHQWSRNFGIHDCPECSKEKKKILYQNRHSKKYIDFLSSKNIELLEDYVNNYTKIKHRCKTCKHEWGTSPSSVMQTKGKICPKCSGMYKMTEEEYLNELENRYLKQFVLNSRFTGLCNQIHASCLKCKSDIHKTAHSLLKNGCKNCSLKELNTKQFYDKLFDIFEGDIIAESDYVNSGTKMKFYRKSCGHHFSISPNHLFDRQSCPKCNKSIGEQKIENFLIKNDIEYIDQKTYDDLRGVNDGLLPYDFYLPKYNMLIEFQGEQHERPIEYFGGEEKFKIQKEHDKQKKEYAKLHNIILLEIWYYDIKDINKILYTEILKKKSLNSSFLLNKND